MKLHGLFFLTIAGVSTLWANNSIESESSHFVGGAIMAGGITAIVDHYYPEYKNDRGMIGFLGSSAAIVIEEGMVIAFQGGGSGDVLDMAAHIAGSAIGAYVTDRYVLSPVLEDSKIEGKYVGLNLSIPLR